MAGIFKAYDIRGIVGTELDEDLAYRIGRAFASLLSPSSVVVGRDMRPHSFSLFEALASGLTEQGVNVIDIGLASTPMTYYAIGSLEADAGIMITASHNPGEYNGFKLCRAEAIPISGSTGIAEIERRALASDFTPTAAVGHIREHKIDDEYRRHIQSLASIQRPLKIAVDYANAMGIVEAGALAGLPIGITPLFDALDGSFPNHEANPLDLKTFTDLQETVRNGEFDFGIAFDGDADRVGFVDEKGDIVSMDMITAVIATVLLRQEKGPVLYDLRSSWATREAIAEAGGQPEMCRVGHAFIKNQMRKTGAIFAGELSGHYYFRENYYTESSALATLLIANLVSQNDKPFSEIVAPFQRYHASGEINSKVDDSALVFARLDETFAGRGHRFELDGLSYEFDDWWFNVRCSNTEPLIRLNLEAVTKAEMEARRDKLLALIRE